MRGVVDYLIDGRITEPSVARRRDSKKGASEEMRERRLVPEVGVEPTHPCGYGILSPARLPVSPLRLTGEILIIPVFGEVEKHGHDEEWVGRVV